jgi:hypothetical protein
MVMDNKILFKTITPLYNSNWSIKADDRYRVNYFDPMLDDANKFKGYNYIVVYDLTYMKQEEVDTFFGKEFRNVGYRRGQCLDFYKTDEEARCRVNVLRTKPKSYYNIFVVVRLNKE